MRIGFHVDRRHAIYCWLMVGFALCGIESQLVAQDKAQDRATKLAPLDSAAFAQELQRLHGICERLGLKSEQTVMQDWIIHEPSDAHLLCLPIEMDIAESTGPVKPGAADGTTNSNAQAASARTAWLKYFSTARARHAQYWYEAAQKSAAAGNEWQAFQQLWRAAREDSAHIETKRVLAPLLSAFSIKGKPRSSTAVHPKFGWPAGSYSRLETTNFKITSRTDAATTQAIATKLETFYALWCQAFYPLWAPPNATAQRLAGRNTNWNRRQQVDVVLCKDRDDYIKTLGVAESNIGVSVGYYNPDSQMSFFFPDDDLDATLHHELTHQLLSEASQLKGASQAGVEHRIWMVEAVALYMESLVKTDYHWRLGGPLAPRIQAARYRAVHDGYWIDTKTLDDRSLEAWKQDPELARLYTHAAGLAHFFMDRRLAPTASEVELEVNQPADQPVSPAVQAAIERLNAVDSEVFRAAFLSALVSVYRGDSPDDKLWNAMSPDDCQQDYLHFLVVRDRHLLGTSNSTAETCKELVLTRSQLCPEAWQAVGGFINLEWLELSSTNVKHKDLTWLGKLTKLKRLGLEGTDVDAALLSQIGTLTELEELDLTNCSVDDQMLTSLGKLPKLQTLWLQGTKVSDASRPWLESQPKLQVK